MFADPRVHAASVAALAGQAGSPRSRRRPSPWQPWKRPARPAPARAEAAVQAARGSCATLPWPSAAWCSARSSAPACSRCWREPACWGPGVDSLLAEQQANFAEVNTKLDTLRQLSADPEAQRALTELGTLLATAERVGGADRAAAEAHGERSVGEQGSRARRERHGRRRGLLAQGRRKLEFGVARSGVRAPGVLPRYFGRQLERHGAPARGRRRHRLHGRRAARARSSSSRRRRARTAASGSTSTVASARRSRPHPKKRLVRLVRAELVF